MTQEEAIKRIKDWNLDDDDMEVLSTLIPELKESEDERTRKELLSLFEDGRDGRSHRYTGSDCERYIAWLEKQGEKNELKKIEQKSAWSEEDEKIGEQLLNWFKGCNWDTIDNGTLKRDDIIAWLEERV